VLLTLVALWGGGLVAQQPAGFDHAKHAKLFPACTSCHAGAASPGQSLWPAAATCTACHDGTIQKRITWQTPESLRTNLRFDHVVHIQKAVARFAAGGKTPPTCVDCHSAAAAPWMAVQPPIVERCFS
jgi:hypothetical protein